MIRLFAASDLHIGFENSRYAKILDLFDIVENKSDRLILCGDVFDLWRFPLHKIEYETKLDLRQCVDRLLELSLEVPIDIIPGNHDFELEKYLKYDKDKYDNLRILNSFYKNNVYFTHGWEFDVQQRFCSFAYSWLVKNYPYIYQKWFRKPSEIEEKNDIYTNLIKIHRKAEIFAKKRKLDYIVMGHTHLPIIYNKIIDCGDFIDSCSYVVIENNEPTLNYI